MFRQYYDKTCSSHITIVSHSVSRSDSRLVQKTPQKGWHDATSKADNTPTCSALPTDSLMRADRACCMQMQTRAIMHLDSDIDLPPSPLARTFTLHREFALENTIAPSPRTCWLGYHRVMLPIHHSERERDTDCTI